MLFLAATEESGIMMSLLRTILMNLCNFIYKLIIYIYELFLAVGNASILNSEQIQVIYSRVGLILGIVMIFRLIFSFVQYMIDPDKITDKETGFGSIIKKFIVVILALALTDWMFNKAFELQEMILEENVIAKVVLGVESNDALGMEEFGVLFSYNLFNYFFYQNPELNSDGESVASSVGCGSTFFTEDLPNYVATFKDFEAVHKCLNEDGDPNGNLWGNKVYYATFDGFEALLVGGAVLWMLIMYTITLGVRVVKLAFLRLIAPIPILSYLSPKKDTPFQKWIKQCVVTYLDLFIRLAIIYFCMLLISVIFQNGAAINASTHLSANDGLYKWFNIILILGILLFAKKLPEILGEIFPSMGGKGGLDLGLGLKSRTDFMGKGVVARGAGAAIGIGAMGALGGLQGFKRMTKDGEQAHGRKRVLNTVTGVASGMARGAYSGATNGGKVRQGLSKGFKGQVAASDVTNKYIAAGNEGFIDRAEATVARNLGLPSAYERAVAEINGMKRRKEKMSKVGGAASSATKGYDAVGDGVKSELEGDKSKLVISLRNSAAAIEQMSNDKTIEAITDIHGNITDYRMVLGKQNKRDANGNYVRDAHGNIVQETYYGDSIVGKKISDLDNSLEGKISIAENTLNTANSNLVNSKNEKQNIIAKMQSNAQSLQNLPANHAQRTVLEVEQRQLQRELDKLEHQISIYEEAVADAEVVRNSINKTNIVKSFKKAALAELILDNYDSPDLQQDFEENLKQMVRSIDSCNAHATDMLNSKDVREVAIGQQYKSAGKTMKILYDLVNDIRTNENYRTVDANGDVIYDLGIINDVIQRKLNAQDVSPYILNAINFDDVNPDGTYGTASLEIETIQDLMDKLSEFNKKLNRDSTRITNDLQSQIEIKEQSAEVLRAKDAQEHIYNVNK